MGKSGLYHGSCGDHSGSVSRLGKDKLVARFDQFLAGHWHELILASVQCAEDAAVMTRRHLRKGCPNTIEKRVERAQRLVQVGELSVCRNALEGADAPGRATLRELNQRPCAPRHPIPLLPDQFPVHNLEEKVFCRNVRSALMGAAGGPSGTSNDHLVIFKVSVLPHPNFSSILGRRHFFSC